MHKIINTIIILKEGGEKLLAINLFIYNIPNFWKSLTTHVARNIFGGYMPQKYDTPFRMWVNQSLKHSQLLSPQCAGKFGFKTPIQQLFLLRYCNVGKDYVVNLIQQEDVQC